MGLYIDFFGFLLLPILGQNYLDRVSGRLEQEVYELPQSSKLCPMFFAFVYGLKQLGFCLSNKRCHCCLMDHVGCDCYSSLHTANHEMSEMRTTPVSLKAGSHSERSPFFVVIFECHRICIKKNYTTFLGCNNVAHNSGISHLNDDS